MNLRAIGAGLALLALVGCDDKPKAIYAAASKVVESDGGDSLGPVWPIMLRHCLSRPACDPMSDFGKGAGEASASWGSVRAFVSSADGGTITLSLPGGNGSGGAIGRPMSADETPSDLRERRDRLGWISVVHGADGKPKRVELRTMQLAIFAPGVQGSKIDEAEALTRKFLEGFRWKEGEGPGAKLELWVDSKSAFKVWTVGAPSGSRPGAGEKLDWTFAPWILSASHELKGGEARELIAALQSERAIQMLAVDPTNQVMLNDRYYTRAYDEALAWGKAALADEKLKVSVADRCKPYADKPDKFWVDAKVSPAEVTCRMTNLDVRR